MTSALPLVNFLRFSTPYFPGLSSPRRIARFLRPLTANLGDPMDLSRSIDQRLDDPAFMVDDYALSGFEMGVESH